MTNVPITKTASFTDIHFGKRNNSIQHNQDCLDFIEWFCQKVKEEGDVSHVVFLGDFFENRNAVNVLTMDYAHAGLKKLDELGIPILLLVGNHDLHHRENRKVFSTKVFNEVKNVQVISEPLVYDKDTLLCPFMFKTEYPSLAQYSKHKYWYGHFEFRNFLVTGTSRLMEHGPDHTQFAAQKYIFSGHYHKRQCRDNVIFMGNTFPMDFGDADDHERGMMICNHKTEEVYFYDWDQAPCFFKTKLSDVVEGRWEPRAKARVRCLLDMEITYSEAQVLKEEFVKAFGLRKFSIEENLTEKKDAVAGAEGGDEELLENLDLSSLKETVRGLLETGINNTTTINTTTLIQIWNEL
jgi:DNA repair exonuclease SbcCD nuclease subunit